jgi:hypothetical protein
MQEHTTSYQTDLSDTQLRRQQAESLAQLVQQKNELSGQRDTLALHEEALLKILKKMTTTNPSQTGQP